jgi:5-(hydroxymethyl)furfural/furfural oxidase
MSNWPRQRASAAICYLDSAVRRRGNLSIACNAFVTGLVFDGRRVAGVRATIGAEQKEFFAREVVVALGGIHSPAFLMRAGIGAAAALRDLGIAVRADLPAVGENLSNHAIVFVGLLQKPGARQSNNIRPHPMTAFRYSSGLPGAPAADMYINVQCKTSWSPLGHQVANLAPSLLKPMARGRVSLLAADPAVRPLVEFNFTGHELDRKRFMQGFRRCVEILAHDAVRAITWLAFPVKFDDRLRALNRITPANKLKSAAIATLIDAVPALASPIFATLAADDDALAEHSQQNVAGTFHPTGTCRMGKSDDRAAVTDAAGRVHGVTGLRVIDASIMPTIPRGNTNIPTIMIAEKLAAEMLREQM